MMLVSTISYIDRNTLALLAPTILRSAHLTNQQYGFIISAFAIAYMFANPMWGWMLDRIGVRIGMTGAVALWTLASISHAFAIGLRSFTAARIVLGFGEGATFPGGMRTVVQTLPMEQRSRGIAIAYSGGSLGAIITPIVVTPVAAAWGWQGAFWFTGALGAGWLALWLVLSRRPNLARHSITKDEDSTRQGAPKWSEARLWGYIAAYSLGSFPAAFILYESAVYLSSALHRSQLEIGKVLWIPPLGWEVGYFFWGWVTDRFAGAGGSFRGMRRLFLIQAMLTLPLALVPLVDSFAAVLALLFLAMFTAAGFIIGAVAYATSHYSTRHSAWIAGIGAGSWSAVTALAMPGFGRLFDLHSYDTAFEMVALFPALAWIIWRLLSHESPAR
jgi:ACS family hexuronate transporter-like MFS transporter